MQKHFLFTNEILKPALQSMFFFSIVGYFIANKPQTIVNRILSGKILQYPGKIDYGFCVWHIAILYKLLEYAITGFLILNLLLLLGYQLL